VDSVGPRPGEAAFQGASFSAGVHETFTWVCAQSRRAASSSCMRHLHAASRLGPAQEHADVHMHCSNTHAAVSPLKSTLPPSHCPCNHPTPHPTYCRRGARPLPARQGRALPLVRGSSSSSGTAAARQQQPAAAG
jgi:hypothetical protein